MKKRLLTIVVILFSLCSFGQKWKSCFTLPTGAWRQSIEIIDSLTVMASTGKGIFRTEDGGKTWTNSRTDVGTLTCAGNTCYYLVGGDIDKSTNGGKTWTTLTRQIPVNKSLLYIKAVSPSTIFVMTKTWPTPEDTTFVSYDGGNSWLKSAMPPTRLFREFITDSLALFLDMDGMNTKVERTKNQGVTKDTTDLLYTYWIVPKAISFLTPKVGYALSVQYDFFGSPPLHFSVLKTSDSAKTFKELYRYTNNSVNDITVPCVQFINEKTGWMASSHITGHGPTLFYKTQDSGKTWQPDTVGLNGVGIGLFKLLTANYGFAFAGDGIYQYGEHIPEKNVVKGRVYLDRNNNCQYDNGYDVPVYGARVYQTALDLNTTTTWDGTYEISPLARGTHKIKIDLPHDLPYAPNFSCFSGERTINFNGYSDTLDSLNYAIKTDVKAKPIVKISGNRLRVCFRNTITVSYKNYGFQQVDNFKVKLKLPDAVILISADKSYTVDADGNYEFNVGTLGPLQEGVIHIVDSVKCLGSVRGLTHCSEVTIEGDSLDYKTDTLVWDNSEVEVEGRCLGTWISFKLKNTSTHDMSDSAELRFFNNAQLVQKQKYKLKAGEKLDIVFPANNTTYRLEADQTPGHPLSDYAQATLEGCKGETPALTSTGFVNRLPVNDFKYRKDVWCEIASGSYDPNDKTAYPQGIGAKNYVKPGTTITYRIRFQNSGNDTAFTVRVVDTLSEHFDLASLRMGAASHNYYYNLKGDNKNVLEVVFLEIYLPDSVTDKVGCNGYFTFTINHKNSIPEGTAINNKAYIYFDFNPAIITNQSKITIKDTVEVNTTHPPINPIDKLPFILKKYTQDTICRGDTISFSIVGEAPYKWMKAGDTLSLGTANLLQVFPVATTSYVGQTKDGYDTLTIQVKNCVSRAIGKVYFDFNNNCTHDSAIDLPLKNITLKEKGSSLFINTDDKGNYELNDLERGSSYTVQPVLPELYMLTAPCVTGGERTVQVNGNYQLFTGQDFAVTTGVIESKPTVKVSGGGLVACTENTAAITYSNDGFKTLTNAVVKVKMPEYVKLLGADKAYTTDAEGNYEFTVGTLTPLQSGTISITDSVMCGSSLEGRTQCIEAYIYGDNVNYKVDATPWDRSEAIVKARCLNNWINFQVTNATAFNMGDSAELRLYSDAHLVEKRKYKLAAGETLNLTFKANYSTYRLEAGQRPGHPISRYAQATIEGCEGSGTGTISTGFVNQLPINDFNYRKHTYCEVIKDNAVTGDKTVSPEGTMTSNIVKAGTPLTYRIRFQNTATSASTVTVKDTLSDNFNLASLNMGPASHAYTHVIKGTGKPVLEVTLDNIPAGGSGYFTYSISHKSAIAQGTAIDNKAHIQVDINSPVTTNTATVTIKDTTLLHPTHPPVNATDKLPFILKGYTKDTLCKGDTVTVVIIGEGPYQWTKQGSTATLGTGHELQIIADTTTIFTGQTKDGSESITLLVKDCKAVNPPDSTTAIREMSQNKVQVYPNPSRDKFYITAEGEEISRVRIFDSNGKMLLVTTQTEIDLSISAAGMYFAEITLENGATTYKKLVKE